MFDHALDCVAWLVNEINQNIRLVDEDELWYEPGRFADNTIGNDEGGKLFDARKMRNIVHMDLEGDNKSSPIPGDLVHQSFIAEATKRAHTKTIEARFSGSSCENEEQAISCIADPDTPTVG